MDSSVDHEPRAVKVDDLVVDELTGEVLELPENAGDLVEFLTYREVELARGESAYKQARFLVKLALKRELEKLDLKSLQTQYGRPVIRSRTTRKGKVERLPRVMQEFELSKEQERNILYAASGLDAKRLESVEEANLVPREAIEALIEETRSEWLQVNPILKTPPVVEKV
ncbi:hypothetical protein LCGC14_2049710 [marine sediment metagenome]|uniref:Uncharacterized protein n=1 Tax=marine sediment metagenome TaxID=412755 RepID=A0A0F9HLC9_9ZZZZ